MHPASIRVDMQRHSLMHAQDRKCERKRPPYLHMARKKERKKDPSKQVCCYQKKERDKRIMMRKKI